MYFLHCKNKDTYLYRTKHSCKYVCAIHNTEKLKNKEIIFEIGLLHRVFVIHSTTLLSYYNIVHVCITTVPRYIIVKEHPIFFKNITFSSLNFKPKVWWSWDLCSTVACKVLTRENEHVEEEGKKQNLSKVILTLHLV